MTQTAHNKSKIDDINVEDIIKIMKKKFVSENITSFFCQKTCETKVRLLELNSSNCILLEFKTLKEEFPSLYDSNVYRLLIILGLYKERNFTHKLQNEFNEILKKENIDRIVLWSTIDLSNEIIQSLKPINVDIFIIKIPDKSYVHKKEIKNFIPIEGAHIEYSLIVNIMTDYLIRRLKKMFHLVLSEIAAPIYEKEYRKSKKATYSIMRFEEVKLRSLIDRLVHEKSTSIAIDVGCGTGRHSYILAKNFETVYAYDISPKMINEADKGKKEQDIRNIIFQVNDFEYEKFLDENQFYSKCDLIVASFGMGSFIEDTPKMLRRFYDWLKPGGHVFISFYNENSITSKLTPNWRDTSLSAQIDVENNSLAVRISPKVSFNIYCKPYGSEIKGFINQIFNVDQIYTHTTILALLPNTLLEDSLAYNIFSYVDEILSDDKKYQYGHYVIVMGHKPMLTIDGYSNIKKILEDYEHEIIEHSPVLSVEDVKREINLPLNIMVKTIIFKDNKSGDFISVSLQSEKRVDKEKLSMVLNISASRIKFASEKEVLKIGFPIGGIAPFGFNDSIKVKSFIDEDIYNIKSQYLYMGVGDNRKTLKIKSDNFLKIIEDYIKIEI